MNSSTIIDAKFVYQRIGFPFKSYITYTRIYIYTHNQSEFQIESHILVREHASNNYSCTAAAVILTNCDVISFEKESSRVLPGIFSVLLASRRADDLRVYLHAKLA